MNEMKTVLMFGAKPENIIYANPFKSEENLAYAKSQGIRLMTFDCEEEVANVQKIFPDAELVLRIAVEDTDAPCPMGKKFGAPREFWPSILDKCKELGMKVRGVSFHVGSGGCSFKAYKDAIEDAKTVFKLA